MANKFVCIHGHFYQPPRENPWRDEIEEQPSAAPYHDWNVRVTEECYQPNTHSMIVNQGGPSTQLVNNYEKISFNFGPTLLSWMKDSYPQVLQSIIEADQKSKLSFHGHGNAIAQAYHHLIMPLANYQDKLTEICWGIEDFNYYFNRKPEGLWLPETAVDLETLDVIQACGIKFTILSPRQAKRVRRIGDEEWSETLETGRPYLQRLPSGNSIVLFFYDGAISQAVAFENLLTDGGNFAQRLIQSVSSTSCNILNHIATDGESYGHHHAFGDMSLAYALQCLEKSGEIHLTNYAHFIEIQPPEYEVEIHPNSSWSCCHGIERWQSNCGCHQRDDWQQTWRGPLRTALDWLRDTLIPQYIASTARYFRDPWQARNDYIKVIHHRNYFSQFIQEQVTKNITQAEKLQLLTWLELQRYALLMYTSCGWFFDEISGLETVQILRYASRVIELARQLTGNNYEPEFIRCLSMAPSNLEEYHDGGVVYQRLAKAKYAK